MRESPTYANTSSDYVELKQVFTTIWHWKWLVVGISLLAAASVFAVSRLTTPVYEASTTLLVNQVTDPRIFDFNPNLSSERLARTYGEMLRTRPMQEEALSRLEEGARPIDFRGSVDVELISGTQLIELIVRDTNPILAATLANTLVEVFAEQNDALQASRFAASKASLSAQLDKLNEQIRDAEDRIEFLSAAQTKPDLTGDTTESDSIPSLVTPDIQDETAITESEPSQSTANLDDSSSVDDLNSPETRAQLAEVERLHGELAQYRLSYTNLLLSFEDLRMAEAQSISNIVQVEPAVPPVDPILPRTSFNTAIAGAVGAMAALGLVFLIDHLDDSIRTSQDVVRATERPVFGYVANTRKLARRRGKKSQILAEPSLVLADSFRSLRMNLELAGVQGMPRSILVSSPDLEDGKTTIAAQLAISIAQGGKRVILVDANLRRPTLHEYFGIENNSGLTDLLTDDLVPQVVTQESRNWRFKVITSGKLVENPADLIGSIKILRMLTRLREQADVTIFDGPPFIVSESFVMASKMEGVLMVMRYGQTRGTAVKLLMEQLQHAQVNVMGVVLNRVPRRMAYGSSGNLSYRQGEQQIEANPAGEKQVYEDGQRVLIQEPEESR